MRTQSLLPLRGSKAGLMMAIVLLSGCKSTRDSMINQATNTPDFRKKIVESGRNSCVAAWQKKEPNQSAELDKTMHTFCDCIALKTADTYTNAELVELGVKGMGSKTPEQKAKTEANIKACEAQAGIP